jgi:two-component system, NarL family, invasion response regulator UvrY
VTIRIVLADNHAQVRSYFKSFLNRQPGLSVVAEAHDTSGAVEAMTAGLAANAPDLLIVDVDMGGGGGIEATRRILACNPAACVLALSVHDDLAIVQAMLDAGARGYVLKADSPSDLLGAIADVLAGRIYLSPMLTTLRRP